MISKIDYEGLHNCVQILNGDAKLVVSTEVGPRILFYGYDGGENILGWHPHPAVETELGTWKPYGGHRLWVAPENMPLSYSPDNDTVDVLEQGELSVRLSSGVDQNTDLEKVTTVTLAESGTGVSIEHTLLNYGLEAREMSAWALTIMRPGGTVIVPNEPFAPYGPDSLLPVRSMAIWSYTDFTDSRWSFEKDAILLRVDQNSRGPQKFGVLNKHSWAGYQWKDLRFTKRSEYVDGAVYPDMNSNFEIYTDGGFVEIETLSPLQIVDPGGSIEHLEKWELSKI